MLGLSSPGTLKCCSSYNSIDDCIIKKKNVYLGPCYETKLSWKVNNKDDGVPWFKVVWTWVWFLALLNWHWRIYFSSFWFHVFSVFSRVMKCLYKTVFIKLHLWPIKSWRNTSIVVLKGTEDSVWQDTLYVFTLLKKQKQHCFELLYSTLLYHFLNFLYL